MKAKGPCVGCGENQGQINGGHGFKGWVCPDCWCGCGRQRTMHLADDGCYAMVNGDTAYPAGEQLVRGDPRARLEDEIGGRAWHHAIHENNAHPDRWARTRNRVATIIAIALGDLAPYGDHWHEAHDRRSQTIADELYPRPGTPEATGRLF